MKDKKEYTEMKKKYLTPAIFEHKLRVESLLTSTSPLQKTKINWGNTNSTSTAQPEEVQTTIDVYEGTDVENI